MNLATPIEIRATYDRLSYGPPLCPLCGSEEIRPPRHPAALSTCGDCGGAFDYVNGSESEPVESGGWVDPSNPWGGWEQDSSDDSCPPASVSLPFAEAVEFLADFPGGIWGHSESESEQNIRTGDWKRVTAHVADEWEDLIFAALNVVAPPNTLSCW